MSGATSGALGASGDEGAAQAKGNGVMQRALDLIERVGNKVPHPVLMFLYLIALVIVLSAILALFGVSVTEQVAHPVPYPVEHNYYEDTTQVQSQVPAQGNEYSNVDFVITEETIPVRSLLTIEGIRFIFTSFVANFQNFGVIAVVFIAMMGAGVAEGAGLLNTLIRKLVEVAPRRIITFLIILVGGLSSIATDAGYLILIPLAASAFIGLRRHPLAGLAAGFASVGAAFGVNLIIQPTDAMITEIANEAIGLTGGQPITVANNLYFSAVSLLFLCVVATFITERMIEPRLGAYDAPARHRRRLVLTSRTRSGHPRRRPRSRAACALPSLACSAFWSSCCWRRCHRARHCVTPRLATSSAIRRLWIACSSSSCSSSSRRAWATASAPRPITSANDVIAAVTKTFASLGGLVLMLLMMAQFIAYFNYSNMPSVIAVALAELLERAAVPPLVLLLGLRARQLPADVHHPVHRAEVGDLRADLHPDLPPPGGLAADRAGRLSHRATRRPTSSPH